MFRPFPVVLLALIAVAQDRDLNYVWPPAAPQQAKALSGIPRSYALVIGIGEYRNLPPAKALLYSEADARDIYSILISPEGGSFPAENVHKLIGPKATLENVSRELEEWLPSVAGEQDRVLIYFAGHGFVFESIPYLAPYDIDLHAIARTAYPMSRLGRAIGSRIRAKWKVLLTDACHSGALIPENDKRALNGHLIDLTSSLFSLTASRDREVSLESAEFGGGHGVFTYYVVRGLEGAADSNRDGIVTADEIAEYVHSNVRQATGGQQNPMFAGSFDNAMPLAYTPGNRKPDDPPPPQYGALAIVTEKEGAEVYIDGRFMGSSNRAAPLLIPGLQAGVHLVKGIKAGYEPDGPREEMVYPGQTTRVTLKIQVIQRRNRTAVEQFDRGIQEYLLGSAKDLQRAAGYFRKALELDPAYAEAAVYLGRTYNALFQQEAALQSYTHAIEVDPSNVEARASFAGALLDTGNLDGAVRQLDESIRRDPDNAMAQYLLAQALCRKGAYADSISAAHRSIRLMPYVGEAHFWLAESLRMSRQWQPAVTAYKEYLSLSNFDSHLAGKLNYYALGFLIGHGRKTRATQHDIWKDLRSQAYFGLCDCERSLQHFTEAIADCRKALAYDPEDPFTHYLLGVIYGLQAEMTPAPELLAAARTHLRRMLAINSAIEEAESARQTLARIESALKQGDL